MLAPRWSYVVCLAASLATVACGSDGDSRPDAQIFLDAPGALVGLGEPCNPAGTSCPANAPLCITSSTSATGYCSALCAGTTITMNGVGSGTFMTDGTGTPIEASSMPPTSEWVDAPCAAIYTGATGAGLCFQVINRMPLGAPMPNTQYTFAVACGIGCTTDDPCPTGFTCAIGTDPDKGVCRPN